MRSSWRAAGLVLTILLGLGLRAEAQQDLSNLSIEALTVAAEEGDVAAQTELGARYDSGHGTLQNYSRAAQWYARAAQAGNPQAQYMLSRYLFTGLGVEKDPIAALNWLEAAAEEGDPIYVLDLARALEIGAGGPADPARAATLYARIAALGGIDAAVALGVLYHEGIGVSQDLDKALELYQKGAASGHAQGLNNLGLLYVRGQGVTQDYERAAQLFSAAAEQGLPQAMSNLGVLYDNGFGVAQSDEKAAQLYRLAARQKNQAMKPDEVVFDSRLAVPKNDAEALVGAEAGRGDPVAQFLMGWLLMQEDRPNGADPQAAARWFRAAAQKGHQTSMVNLGRQYKAGRGVPQDYVLAQMWMVLASTADPDLAARMTSDQINEAQSRAEAIWSGLQGTN